VAETIRYVHNHRASAVAVAALAGSLVLAAAFGAIRAATVRIWISGGQAWSQGNLLTAGLWVVALAVHLGYDALLGSSKHLAGLGSATMLLSW
jgi:hypothetical protein